jgi:pseudaminic acid cytidylyltransferase
MNIAIIPARGGSKRIPGKNIKPFAGKPIIAHSIEVAKRAGVFDRIIVTTDSKEIAEVARRFGGETPFMRPPELSDDHTPTAPVVAHCLEWLVEHGAPAQYACCIYATAPFVQAAYIRQGCKLLSSHGVASVFSVTSFPFPIFRALKIEDNGHLSMFWPEYEMTRSNDLTEAYHDAGQFYWLNVDRFLQDRKIYTPDALPVVLPRYLVQDIDTAEDWETAEHMYKALQLAGKI